MQDLVPWPGIEPGPPHGEHRVLACEAPGKFQECLILPSSDRAWYTHVCMAHVLGRVCNNASILTESCYLENWVHLLLVGMQIDTATMEKSMEIPLKLGIKLPYDPAILLLGICPEETIIEKDTCTQCSLQHWLQELGHGSNLDVHWQMNPIRRCDTYIQWNILSYKKECIWVSSNEVDKPWAYYTKWSKSKRKTPIQYTNAYIWNLERW